MARARRTLLQHWWRDGLRPAAERARDWLAADALGAGQGLSRGFALFLVLFGVGMLLISLVGDQGWIAYLQLRAEKGRLEQRIQEATGREAQLRREVKALGNDADYIEQVAREKLGLVKPGEEVIELIPRQEARK